MDLKDAAGSAFSWEVGLLQGAHHFGFSVSQSVMAASEPCVASCKISIPTVPNRIPTGSRIDCCLAGVLRDLPRGRERNQSLRVDNEVRQLPSDSVPSYRLCARSNLCPKGSTPRITSNRTGARRIRRCCDGLYSLR